MSNEEKVLNDRPKMSCQEVQEEKPDGGLEEAPERAWPEEPNDHTSRLALIYQRWTYSYMSRVLSKGSRQMRPDGTHLSEDDLYVVPPSMNATFLLSKFREFYKRKKGEKRRLLKTLWHLASPTFVPAGFCQLITVFSQVAIPVMVRELLRIVEENPSATVIKEGMPFAIFIFVAALINAFGDHRHRYLATKTGVVLRASLVNVIYDNALHLTPEGRAGLTSGQVTTLVAVDTQKLFEVTQEGHLIWSCPLSITLVTILLLIIMGPTTLVGMAVLILFLPLVQFIMSRMLVIRRERFQLVDQRVNIVNAMLQGIKVTKLNNYELKYQQRIGAVREQEVKLLRRELFFWAMTLVITVTSPVIASAATFVTYVLVSEDNILTAATTFTVLLLFAALRFPINYAGRLIGRAAQALDSMRRIANFLDRDSRCDREDDYSKLLQSDGKEQAATETEASCILNVQGATFRVGSRVASVPQEYSEANNTTAGSQAAFSINDVNFSLSAGQILAIVGPVGSGKSTLLNGIIGEAQASHDTLVSKRGSVAYAGQIPFILNATLRANILFGLPFEKERYEAVIEACCLHQDIEQLGGARDLTEIGERGVTLSGGQKQRVSLARVAYAAPDIVLCDDPLSALDASTGKKIFDQLFDTTRSTLLGSSAIVLVTHAAHFLNRVDEILVVVNGSVKFRGNWSALTEFKSDDSTALAAIDFIRSSVQEGGDRVMGDDSESSSLTNDTKSNAVKSKNGTLGGDGGHNGSLIVGETREHGLSSLQTWLLWFKNAGGLPFLFIQCVLMTLDRLAYVGTEVWLSLWTKGDDTTVNVFGKEFPPQTEGRSAQYQYLAVYGIILAISVTSTFMRSEWAVNGGARCAKTVFEKMLASVLRAPVSYFETVPLGRILNRFTYDVEFVDVTLTEAMSTLMISISWFVAGIFIMCIIVPWIALALLPVTLLYGLLMFHYRKSGADLQRIDATTRSPIQAMLAEGLDGASTIRVFRRENMFLRKFQSSTDTNSSAQLNYISAQRWLSLRIELIGSVIVLVACVLVISLNDTLQLSAGFAGLLIIWSSNFTITLGFMVDTFAETEASITSIERVHAMCELPEEKPMLTDKSVDLPASWPQRGLIEFKDVKVRYREGLPLALNGLSFTVAPGERCGICGRTGAGKSTLTVALFRLVELESGSILVDGIDLANLGLSDVRESLSIIPQDPFLLAGTLRDCLDPFAGSSDGDILEALKAVRLVGSGADASALESRVDEGGSNFSVGERQLLCLARALLAKPTVLVLDEATASVDGETDEFIQRMLRTRFQKTTLLTVAHRLHTIMDYDTILVMDGGRAAEYGSPKELIEKQGVFADLVTSTGEDSARALREVALGKK